MSDKRVPWLVIKISRPVLISVTQDHFLVSSDSIERQIAITHWSAALRRIRCLFGHAQLPLDTKMRSRRKMMCPLCSQLNAFESLCRRQRIPPRYELTTKKCLTVLNAFFELQFSILAQGDLAKSHLRILETIFDNFLDTFHPPHSFLHEAHTS